MCAPHCTLDDLNNSTCDNQCNTEECGYDNGHCGCAAGCFSTDPCSTSCAVPDCGYNECPSCQPPISCSATHSTTPLSSYESKASEYYNLINRDFSHPFVVATDCTKGNPACDEGKLASALKGQTCVQECNVASCAMSFGYCFMVKAPAAGSTTIPPTFTFSIPANSKCTAAFCNICYGPNAGNCLECKTGYYQLFTSCVTSCPPFYVVHPKVTNLCYRKV